IKPRIIIHGGAGNITPENLPPALYHAHKNALLKIVASTAKLLENPNTTAVDAACYAVSLLELNPLYNAGRGAVFTTAGRIEHEASVMVSDPHPLGPRGHGAATSVKHPILLAKEILVRGRQPNGGGAGGHNQLSGSSLEDLARQWGLDIVPPSWFWERKRWDQHRHGLGLSADTATFERDKRRADKEAGYKVPDGCWNGSDYLPQGTVGAVVLDRFGTICTATSTGGMTNKLPGRIGDTPTIGAGFWAESWIEQGYTRPPTEMLSPLSHLMSNNYSAVTDNEKGNVEQLPHTRGRAIGLSGTGNGDSFLRLCAGRTVAAIALFAGTGAPTSLSRAVSAVAGPNGALQVSAEDRWGKTGEGEGGFIGVELLDGAGQVVSDFNCGGMFRAWIDNKGVGRMMVF
ncbi:N-terminal nucleophile aminohydrolase, partial [Myriangium duriaei CBS 260.36]